MQRRAAVQFAEFSMGMGKIQLIILIFLWSPLLSASDKNELNKDPQPLKYVKPNIGDLAHLAEAFDGEADFKTRWIKSEAKKDGVDETISKYDGKWAVEEPAENPLVGDLGVTLKSEAKHAAIAAPLPSKFKFDGNPLFLQYEVRFQKSLECGGAYIKLLADTPKLNLEGFGDKTEYTIMFGPDKCGHDGKIHFILQHKNPSNGRMEEKHAKAPSGDFGHVFTDKKAHLFTLIVRPGNTFDILVDKRIVNTGSLLTDMDPPINPPKEIDDPTDKKPEDWDEREKIPDPFATKPLDWDEDAPRKIPDPNTKKPEDWNEDDPEHIPDPNAVRPKDWDDEEDGDWEAPLIPNPKCKEVGCGEWKASLIDNPSYKGKWTPPLIANPAYKGMWKPKKIVNPNYFEDSNPFGSLKPIAAVGFELWSMQSDITFDNIILASDQSIIDQWTSQTWDLKHAMETTSEPSAISGMMSSILTATEGRPWLWALYAIVLALPFILIYIFCFPSKKDRAAERKKTDEPAPDDLEDEEPVASDEDADSQAVGVSAGAVAEAESDSEVEMTSEAVTESVDEVGSNDSAECENKKTNDDVAAKGNDRLLSDGKQDEQVPVNTPSDEADVKSGADESPSKVSASTTADSPTSSPRNSSQKRKPRKET